MSDFTKLRGSFRRLTASRDEGDTERHERDREGSSMEKRRFRRTDFGAHGTFTTGSTVVSFDLIDLSLKGALINPVDTAVLQIGDTGSVTIELSGTSIAIKADAELVHREYDYFGLRFTMIDLDSMTHLRRLIELNTPEDGDLERELGFLIQK